MPALDLRIEVVPKKQKLLPPPALLQRAVSEDALDLLERLMDSERHERGVRMRFDAAVSAATPQAVPLSTRLLEDLRRQTSVPAPAPGAPAPSEKDEKLAPALAVTREQLYDLIRTIQAEGQAARECAMEAAQRFVGDDLNETLIEEENKRDAEVARLRRERNRQTEQWGEMRLKLEAKQFTAVSAMARESASQLSELRIREMAAREQQTAELALAARKQADEFTRERLALEAAQAKRVEELKAKQSVAVMNIVGKFLPGEEKALSGAKMMVYLINAQTMASLGATAEYHFRYAESQFLRLANSAAEVTQVDYVVNPSLVHRFNAKANAFATKYKKPADTILGFHGTSSAAIDGIIRTNFSVAKLGSNTGDQGYFGAGIYFSEFTGVSLGYNRDTSRLLLSKVLIGRAFQCRGMIVGAPLQNGFDSHLSPDKTEVVIYDNAQILPCYIVHYRTNANAAVALSSKAVVGEDEYLRDFAVKAPVTYPRPVVSVPKVKPSVKPPKPAVKPWANPKPKGKRKK